MGYGIDLSASPLMRTYRIAAVTALATFAVPTAPGWAQSVRSIRTDAPVPFRVGEALTYDVTWSSALVAGSVVTTVIGREAAVNSSVYRIMAEGRPLPMLERLYHLYYRMESMLDSVTLLSHRASVYREEGSDRHTTMTTFDRTARLASFEGRSGAAETTALTVPQQTQDGLSAIYIVRTMPLKPGESFTLPIADEGRVYHVRADVGEAERVAAPFGDLDAWNVRVTITDDEGAPAAEDAAVWITSDARRLPVRMQAKLPVGDFVLTLRDVE